jgi:RNA polymerase sigma factor (sigma-70 family)
VSVSDQDEDEDNFGSRTESVCIADDSTRPDVHGDFFVISRVRQAIARLTQTLQRVYKALYIEGQTQRELAEELCVSQPRVAKLHHQLLQEVRTLLIP